MQIREVKIGERENYIDLLLLADEELDMVKKYINDGKMYAIDHEGDRIASILIIFKESSTIEIKNLAVKPAYQKKGYGKFLIEFVNSLYRDDFDRLIVGTGDSPSNLNFYKHCGFSYHDRIKNFFKDNYSQTIIEDGVELVDMIYLKRHMR